MSSSNKQQQQQQNSPLFPRVHVSQTRDGPRAPPRNKMALYEQLTVPSQHYLQQHNPPAALLNLYRICTNGGSTAHALVFCTQYPTYAGYPGYMFAQQQQQHQFEEMQRVPLVAPAGGGESSNASTTRAATVAAAGPQQRRKVRNDDDFAVPTYARQKVAGSSRNRQGQQEAPSLGVNQPASSFGDSGDSEEQLMKGPGQDEEEREQAATDESNASIVDCAGKKIVATDIIAAVGEAEFWRIRKKILRQQRIFASHVFELHRVTEVQHRLAEAPSLLQSAPLALPEPPPRRLEQGKLSAQGTDKNKQQQQQKHREKQLQQDKHASQQKHVEQSAVQQHQHQQHQHQQQQQQQMKQHEQQLHLLQQQLQPMAFPYSSYAYGHPWVPCQPFVLQNLYQQQQLHQQHQPQQQQPQQWSLAPPTTMFYNTNSQFLYHQQQYPSPFPPFTYPIVMPQQQPHQQQHQLQQRQNQNEQHHQQEKQGTAARRDGTMREFTSTSELTIDRSKEQEQQQQMHSPEGDNSSLGGFAYVSPLERLSELSKSRVAPRAVMATPESAADILKSIQRER